MWVINLTTFGFLISRSQQDSALSFAAWIVLGLIVGFIGSKLMNKTRHGLRRDCLLGIVGAIVGGFFSNLLAKPGVAGVGGYCFARAMVSALVLFVFHSPVSPPGLVAMKLRRHGARMIYLTLV